ncbi:hypothetical protein [Oenococcus oeni]|uniref:hypothetical protein n=1 Tax=Oenococcus oeni TaxID=1247 RepID=UPI000B1ED776
MYWLLVLIIGFLIGTIAGTTINKKEAMGWIAISQLVWLDPGLDKSSLVPGDHNFTT